jgi:hypothetical protein
MFSLLNVTTRFCLCIRGTTFHVPKHAMKASGRYSVKLHEFLSGTLDANEMNCSNAYSDRFILISELMC